MTMYPYIVKCGVALTVAAIAGICRADIVIELESIPGSPSWESSGVWTESNATVEVTLPTYAPGAIELSITPLADPSLSWTFKLIGPDGVFPGPGTYPVQRYLFQQPGFAGGDIRGSCNSAHGDVVVYEVSYEPDETLAAIGADLSYSCDNRDVFSIGKVRFNSNVPLNQPGSHAVATPEQVVALGATVILDGSMSFADNATISEYRWRQLEGQPVQLANEDSSITTFEFPSSMGEHQQMLFELIVVDDLGRSDRTQVQVLSGALQAQDFVNLFEQGNNFVWRREFSGYGTNPASPYTSFGAAQTGIFVRTSGRIIDITPPKGRELRIGGYTSAQRNGLIDLLPGAVVWGCNYGPSDGTPYETYFDILDVSYSDTGVVDRVGFDFNARCEAGNRNTYFGSVRLGTYAPPALEYPRALAGNDVSLYAGEPGYLIGIFSRSPDNSIQSFRWTQISGPTVSIADASSAIARVVAPDTISTESVATFKLDVTDKHGRTASDLVHLTIIPITAPRTFLHVHSDASTFIGGGETAHLRDGQDTSIRTIVDLLGPQGSQRDRIQASDQNTRSWRLFLYSGDDGVLLPGYQSDTFDGDPNNVLPQLSVANTGRGCSRSSGAIEVLGVERDSASVIDSIALDFELTCQGESGKIRGSFRLNSNVASSYTVLSANAGPDQTVQEASEVVLVDNSGPEITTTWTQYSGPALNLFRNGKRASFVPPTIPAGESRYFSFKLTNQRSDGAWGEDFVVIRVNDNGRTDWDGVDFDKYVDKPQAFTKGNGEAFGFRLGDSLGNLARLDIGARSLIGTRVGADAVIEEIFPVTFMTYRGVSGSIPVEYFTHRSLNSDYKLIVEDPTGEWNLVATGATGDGLFRENNLTRLRITVPSQNNSGGSFDLDNQGQSLTFQFAVVRLGPPSAVPPQGGGGGGGGGSVGYLALIAGLMLIRWRWPNSIKAEARERSPH